MSWSLAIQNGDLVHGGNGFNTVAGGAKLVQDLRCVILEPMGTDSLHPSYGSIIDGGVDTNGTYHEGIIGQINDASAASMVRAELQRIVKGYQGQQVARNNTDLAVYGKSTLTADEALLNIASIALQQVQDEILVTATLQTGVTNLPLTQTFSG